MPRPQVSPVVRFWRRVKKIDNGCWIWKGAYRYGILFLTKRERISAHRYSWELHNKQKIPSGMIIRHTCDTPACVRPDHLLLGTLRDNTFDMISRNRQRGWFGNGESHPLSILTREDVSDILVRYASGKYGYKSLAKMFDVAPTTIQHIVQNRTWKDVHGR